MKLKTEETGENQNYGGKHKAYFIQTVLPLQIYINGMQPVYLFKIPETFIAMGYDNNISDEQQFINHLCV